MNAKESSTTASRGERRSPGRDVVQVLGLAACLSIVSATVLVLVAGWSGSLCWSVVVAGLVAVTLGLAVPVLARRRHRGSDAADASVLTRPVAGPVLLVAATTLVSLTWLWPGAGTVTPDPVPGTVRLARPGATELAVHVTRAAAATRPPLVVVHGGPGVADMAHDVPAFAALATDRDVYVYDQIGTGASSRLSDPAGYTLARAVQDLEAVRALTGAERIALLGHSWGAAIAVGYLSQHPDRVQALVLSAPAGLPGDDGSVPPGTPASRLDAGQSAQLYLRVAWPRNLLAYALTAADPQVAHAVAGDAEMDRRFVEIYEETAPALFCDSGITDRLGTTGVGYYANQIPQLHPDDAGALVDASRLSSVRAPVLVIKPACDYLPWHFATEYLDVLPTARLVLLPDAGHQAYLERPDAYTALVRDFLAGRDLPLPLEDGQSIPDGYRGVR